MKTRKTLVAALVVLFSVMAVACDKTDGTRGGGGYDPRNPVDEFVFVVSPTGVDILQLGEPFVQHPGQQAIYDRVQLDNSPDALAIRYRLYKDNKDIGLAYLEANGDGSLAGMALYMDNMMLENGVKPRMLVSTVLSSPDIVAKGSYNHSNSAVDIDICYKNAVDMYIRYSDLTAEGRAKVDLIAARATADPAVDTVITFTAADFTTDARISEVFHLGIDYE